MNKREQFGFMRANREKQRQVAAYGRLLDAISRDALGVQQQSPARGGFGTTPFKPPLGTAHDEYPIKVRKMSAVMHPDGVPREIK